MSTFSCRGALLMVMLTAAIFLTGCQSSLSIPAEVTVAETQTLPGHGAGQGVTVHDGFVYLFGDDVRGESGTGIIRQYAFDPAGPRLNYTGKEVRLEKDGQTIVPHPTGFTHHPEFGCFLGNTVSGKGTIYHIDWPTALREGNLDNAVLNVAEDDAAVNGCRPEFVRVDGRWLVATSDYGNKANEVRLMDPLRLAKASRTLEAGVVVDSYRCGPWVQSLHWIDDQQVLALVQNQIVGLYYRLTFVELGTTDDLRDFEPTDFSRKNLSDELEGWAVLPGGWCVFFSSSSMNNVWFGRFALEPADKSSAVELGTGVELAELVPVMAN